MPKKVTVITVCRNEVKTIARTIKSILSQTYKNIEHIIIDGGSTDGTQKIIEKYRKEIAYFISEPDTGIYNAMNKGIRHSTGEYLLFLNAGDYFYKNNVVKKIFDTDPTEDIVFGDLIFDDHSKKIFEKFPNKIDLSFLLNYYIPHPTSFIKKELFTEHGLYDENYRIAGDYDFFLREIIRHNVSVKHIPIFVSVFNLTGISADPKNKDLQNKERIIAQIKNLGWMRYQYYLNPKIRKLKDIWKKISNKTYMFTKTIIKYFLKHTLSIYIFIFKLLYHGDKNTKKLLVVGDFGTFGGSRDYLKGLLRLLKKNKYQISIAYSKKIADKEMDAFIKNLNIKYRSISHSFNSASVNYSNHIKLNKIMNSIKELFSLTLIILTERPVKIIISAGGFSFITAFCLPIKLFYIIHVYPLCQLENKISTYFVTNFFSEEKNIITVSNFTKSQLLRYIIPKHKADQIKVIYPSFKKDIIKQAKIKKEGKIVLTIGHVADSKNPELWMDVAMKVSDKLGKHNVNFLWVGGGYLTDEYINSCRIKVTKLRYDNIKFVGYKSSVDEYLSKATVYFQPSKIESFGLSVVDAMKHSLPILTSTEGGLPEVNKNGVTGFVVSLENKNVMIVSLIKLLNNPKLCSRFGRNGRNRYLRIFKLEIWETNMLKLLKN